MLADALSHHPNYTTQEVSLLQGTGVIHEVIDVLMDEYYEALSRGCLVVD